MKDKVPFYFETRSVSGTCTTISGENNFCVCKHTNYTHGILCTQVKAEECKAPCWSNLYLIL